MIDDYDWRGAGWNRPGCVGKRTALSRNHEPAPEGLSRRLGAFSVPLTMPSRKERGRRFSTGIRSTLNDLRGAAGEARHAQAKGLIGGPRGDRTPDLLIARRASRHPRSPAL